MAAHTTLQDRGGSHPPISSATITLGPTGASSNRHAELTRGISCTENTPELLFYLTLLPARTFNRAGADSRLPGAGGAHRGGTGRSSPARVMAAAGRVGHPPPALPTAALSLEGWHSFAAGRGGSQAGLWRGAGARRQARGGWPGGGRSAPPRRWPHRCCGSPSPWERRGGGGGAEGAVARPGRAPPPRVGVRSGCASVCVCPSRRYFTVTIGTGGGGRWRHSRTLSPLPPPPCPQCQPRPSIN